MSIKDVTKMIEDLKALEAMKAELEADIESIKDELKREMERRETEEMSVGVYKVRYKTVITNRLDSSKLKQESPKIYEAYCKQVSSKRFSIA